MLSRIIAWVVVLSFPIVTAAEECKSSADRENQIVVDLSVQVSNAIPNDTLLGTLVFQLSDTSLESLAKQVNSTVGSALVTSKKFPTVVAKTGQTHTFVNYEPSTGRRLKSWTMKSELILESRDRAAFGELVGILQEKFEVTSIQQQASQGWLKANEDDAIGEAVQAFKRKSTLVAGALGKDYRIVRLAVSPDTVLHRNPVMLRTSMAKAEAMNSMPLPVEMGATTISVSVSGQIGLR